jgi:hypothetical protein
MSEVRINLCDANQILHGEVHGSVGDRLVAALSAEPETLSELEAALARYEKPDPEFPAFQFLSKTSEIDYRPWDAGVVVIDLAGRIVAVESVYSNPGPEGEVTYHNGEHETEVRVQYRLPDDWLFLRSIEEYEVLFRNRRQQRAAIPPLDTRSIMYGPPLVEWIIMAVRDQQPAISQILKSFADLGESNKATESEEQHDQLDLDGLQQQISAQLSTIHARWLLTPREDLRGKSPREVLLAKQDLIDYDLHTRAMQWSLMNEGPPCLSMDSFAYRFGGFGTHEWVIYYDLLRKLIWHALNTVTANGGALLPLADVEKAIRRLEEVRDRWLNEPQSEYDDRTPTNIIENERRRLPIAIQPKDMIVDEDCPMCQMMADEIAFPGPGFWHLDGAHMDDEFAFSWFRTREEWEEEQRRREAFDKEYRAKQDKTQPNVSGVESEADLAHEAVQ